MGAFSAWLRREEEDPGSVKSFLRHGEPILMTVVTLWLGWVSEPEDPFLVYSTFPWPLATFILIALRYGFMDGLLNVAAYLLILYVGVRESVFLYPSLPYQYIIGMLVMTMITGEFRDLWQRRLQTLDAANAFAQMRLQEFTKSFHLQKVSHDQLEQQLAGSRQSLREGISRVTRLTRIVAGMPVVNDTVAKGFLNLVSGFAHAEEAAIFFIEGSATLRLLVSTGHSEEYATDDVMLRACLEQGKIITVSGDSELPDQQGFWQAVIPVVDSQGTVWALLAVRQIPFWAFEDKTLRLLGVMSGYIADRLSDQAVIKQNFSPELNAFLANTQRCLENARRYQVPSTIAHFQLGAVDTHVTLLDLIQSSKRGIDSVYVLRSAELFQVFALMPLTDESGYEGYLMQLDERLRALTGSSLATLPIQLSHQALKTADQLNAFFQMHLKSELQDVDSTWHFV